MILYLSGNFPQLSDIKKERAMAKRLKSMGIDYHRLLTFYYKKDCETILKVAKEMKFIRRK
jgi:hypothetical protein